MIIPAQTLRKIKPVEPFCERTVFNGKSYGLSSAGYDIRVGASDQGNASHENMSPSFILTPGQFCLAASLERFVMPKDVLGQVADKSSWARQGLSVFNTIIEPGWEGYLTLELKNSSNKPLVILEREPIAQIIFHRLEAVTEQPYTGKYQNQGPAPQEALSE